MYFNTKEMSIYYEKYGTNEKVILILPGWGNTKKTFKNIINELIDKYTIYIFDYPSFGNSPFPNKDLTIYDYALTIKNFMQEKKINNPIIIAHSFGGRIATILNGYYKEKIDKMILIDIAGIKPKKTIKSYLKQTLYKILKKLTNLFPKRKKVLQKKLLNIFASTDYKEIKQPMQQTFKNIIKEDLTSIYQEIDTTSLIIWGELDDATPLKDAYKINKKIKDSALIVYPKAGHFSYLDYPHLTNKIIKEFLKEKKKPNISSF